MTGEANDLCKCDRPSIILARLGATITALVNFEPAIQEVSLGGGFAAGVAGEKAIGLVAITSFSKQMKGICYS